MANTIVNMKAPPSNAFVHGDPGPFGLLCFGMTTCMLMFITTGWTDSKFLPTVFCYAMFYGGFGQFVAGVLELINGNTFGGTAFASYGSFWMGWFLLEYLMKEHKLLYPGAATGKTLWCGLWAFLTAGFFIVTMRKNGCLMTIFSSLVLTFMLLAGGVWDAKCEKAAGYMGFFCGSSAIYAAFAFLYKIELGITLPGVRPVNCLALPPFIAAHPGAMVRPDPATHGSVSPVTVVVAGGAAAPSRPPSAAMRAVAVAAMTPAFEGCCKKAESQSLLQLQPQSQSRPQSQGMLQPQLRPFSGGRLQLQPGGTGKADGDSLMPTDRFGNSSRSGSITSLPAWGAGSEAPSKASLPTVID